MIQERIDRKIMEPFTGKQLERRQSILRGLVSGELVHPGTISFYVVHQEPDVISVGIKNIHWGMWLFDANGRLAIEGLEQDSLTLVENPTDMILGSTRATISEINKKLPAFLKRNYPDLTRLLEPSRQRVVSRKTRPHAA